MDGGYKPIYFQDSTDSRWAGYDDHGDDGIADDGYTGTHAYDPDEAYTTQEWKDDVKKSFYVKKKRWETRTNTYSYLLHHMTEQCTFHQDKDEVLMIRFPRSAFRQSAESFGDFDPSGDCYRHLWKFAWQAIYQAQSASIGRTKKGGSRLLDVFLECANTKEQCVRLYPIADAYPPMSNFLEALPYYHLSRPERSDLCPDGSAVHEYRIWTVARKGVILDGLLKHIAVGAPSSNAALDDWINCVSVYSGISRLNASDELSSIREKDSDFNPSVVFSIQKNASINAAYLTVNGALCSLRFPHANKVLVIPGRDRDFSLMEGRLLPEFQVRWSDPIVRAVFAVEMIAQNRKSHNDAMRGSEEAAIERSRARSEGPLTRDGCANGVPAEIDLRIKGLICQLRAGGGNANGSNCFVPTDASFSVRCEDGDELEHQLLPCRMTLSMATPFSSDGICDDPRDSPNQGLFEESRISTAISSIVGGLDGNLPRYNELASALCFRFMSTQFRPDSTRASPALRIASKAYHEGLVSVTMRLPDAPVSESGSVFSTLISSTCMGIKHNLNIPAVCIPIIAKLILFRGRAYTTTKGLGLNVFVIGESNAGKSSAFKGLAALSLKGTIQEITRSTAQADADNEHEIDFIRMENEKDISYASSSNKRRRSMSGHSDCASGVVSSREAAEKTLMESNESVVRRFVSGKSVTFRSRKCGMMVGASNDTALTVNAAFKNRYHWIYLLKVFDESFVDRNNVVNDTKEAREFVSGLLRSHVTEMVYCKLMDSGCFPEPVLIATNELMRLVNMKLKEYSVSRYPGRNISQLASTQMHRIREAAKMCVLHQGIAMIYAVSPTSPEEERRDEAEKRPSLYGKTFRPEDLINRLGPWLKDSEEIAAFCIGLMKDETHNDLENIVFDAIRQTLATRAEGNDLGESVTEDSSIAKKSNRARKKKDKPCARANQGGAKKKGKPNARRDDDYVVLNTSVEALVTLVMHHLERTPRVPLKECVRSMIYGMERCVVNDHPRTSKVVNGVHGRDLSMPRQKFNLLRITAQGTRLHVHASVMDPRPTGEDLVKQALAEVLGHKHSYHRHLLYGQPVDHTNTHVYQTLTPVCTDPRPSMFIDTPSYIRETTKYQDATWEIDCDLDTVVTKERLFTLGMPYGHEAELNRYHPSRGCRRSPTSSPPSPCSPPSTPPTPSSQNRPVHFADPFSFIPPFPVDESKKRKHGWPSPARPPPPPSPSFPVSPIQVPIRHIQITQQTSRTEPIKHIHPPPSPPDRRRSVGSIPARALPRSAVTTGPTKATVVDLKKL